MITLAAVAVSIVAVLHFYILVLESFLWDKATGRRVFRLTPESAAATKTLAQNQGVYNGFLAAGLAWSVYLGVDGAGRNIAFFFLACVTIAGVVGAFTVGRRILYVQALPALVAWLLVLLIS